MIGTLLKIVYGEGHAELVSASNLATHEILNQVQDDLLVAFSESYELDMIANHPKA